MMQKHLHFFDGLLKQEMMPKRENFCSGKKEN